MQDLFDSVPESMTQLYEEAAKATKNASKVFAFSHIDADGISALAIVIKALKREGKELEWKNIHQINSETILEIKSYILEYGPDLVIFSDFGTGQIGLIRRHILNLEGINHIIILDHHLPQEDTPNDNEVNKNGKLIEINPCHHDINGSVELSGAGTAFLFAMSLSSENIDQTELAIVGATGDLQDYYGKGFTGLNAIIAEIGEDNDYLHVTRDLTFFGINTRPLPYLLQYATDPYLPGLTGDEVACYRFFEDLGIEMKDNDEWRTWVDLESNEKQIAIQSLIQYVFEVYNDPKIAKGLVGDVIILPQRPEKTEMRSAKEFSTLLNACGRNLKPEVGVKICLGEPEAILQGHNLLQQHRANLAMALRRLETDGFQTMDGLYLVRDPETPDTIIGIVIGMAQGARIIPIDKPVLGVSTQTHNDSPLVKLSGRAHRSLVKQGLNLKEIFVSVSDELNEKYDTLIAEAGGHPMAAGAFIHRDHVDEFLKQSSMQMASILKETK